MENEAFPADIDDFFMDISTITYGYAKPLFWIRMPDGKRTNMITRGKLVASLAVLRMNYPFLKLQQVGELPKPKRKK
jgi:hypothetical protein